MHLRRIFVACTLTATVCTVASAELVDLNKQPISLAVTDPLEALTKTLSKGAYYEQAVEPIPSNQYQGLKATELNVSIGGQEKVTVLNNELLERKYPATILTNTYISSNSPYDWLIAHPLPNARISSSYGTRTMNGRAERHSGLDLAAPTGTPIYATGPGVVTKSGWGTGYGQYVEINHGNGYVTRYAHASRLIARVGQQVSAGQHIANVGCTGRCTGPHLHYEVVKNGQRKNPSPYLAMLP